MEWPGVFSSTAGLDRGLDEPDWNAVLRDVLISRACRGAVLRTIVICTGIHLIVGWGLLTNWSEHEPLAVCLIRLSHPAGYGGMPLSMLSMYPTDAALLATAVCAAQMPRMMAVRRGELPYLPPEALHRGALALLFPRGCRALPRLSSLLGVALVWGTLTGAVSLMRSNRTPKLHPSPNPHPLPNLNPGPNPSPNPNPNPSQVGLLVALVCWLLHASTSTVDFCVPGWPYIATRTCLLTLEAAAVCAGSFCLWCSKATDPQALSTLERLEARREAELFAARLKEAAFAGLQPLCGAAAGFALYCSLQVRADRGAAPREVWAAGAAVSVAALGTCALGLGVTLHHRRDEQHASKPLRPGVVAAAYLALLVSCTLGALVLAAVAVLARPTATEGVLQNWAWRKAVAPPFSDPLEVARAASDALQRLSVACGVLCGLQAAAAVLCLKLLGGRGTRALLPLALGATCLLLAALTAAACFVYGTAACYASPFGCRPPPPRHPVRVVHAPATVPPLPPSPPCPLLTPPTPPPPPPTPPLLPPRQVRRSQGPAARLARPRPLRALPSRPHPVHQRRRLGALSTPPPPPHCSSCTPRARSPARSPPPAPPPR